MKIKTITFPGPDDTVDPAPMFSLLSFIFYQLIKYVLL